MNNEEYKKDEYDITQTVSDKLRNEVRLDNPITLQQLLPDYEIETPCLLWTPVAPVPYLFAFCRQLVLPMIPLPGPAFRNFYGIDLPTVIKLVRNKRVIPVLDFHTTDIVDLFPSEFQPLLESVHVPNLFVRSLRLQIDSQDSDADLQTEECVNWTRRLIQKFFDDVQGTTSFVRDYLSDLSQLLGLEGAAFPSKYVFETLGALTTRSVLLSHSLHKDEYLRKIVSIDNPEEALAYMVTLLASRDNFALTGDLVPVMDSSTVEALRGIHENMPEDDRIVSCTRYSLGELNVRLEYSHPENLSMDEVPKYVDRLHDATDIEKHLKIMTSFQKHLERGQFDRAISESVRFSEAWNAVQERVKKIEGLHRWTKCFVYPAFAAFSAAFLTSVAMLLGDFGDRFSFPIAASSAVLSVAGLGLDQVKSKLDTLSRDLTGRICGRESLTFLVWDHGKTDQEPDGHRS